MKAVSRPADNSKVIGLGVSVVVVFAFVVWRVISALGGSAPPAPSGDAANQIGTQGPEVQVGAGAPIAAEEDQGAQIVVDTFSPGSTPNPFHKDTDGGMIPPSMGGPPPVVVVKRQRPHGGPPIGQPIPIIDPQQMQVEGVMTGLNPVAVISVGDKQFVVNRGESFGVGKALRLRDVSTTQVVVEEGKQLHYLRVGMRPPGSTRPIDVVGGAPAPTNPDAGTKSGGQIHTRTLPAPANPPLTGAILPG